MTAKMQLNQQNAAKDYHLHNSAVTHNQHCLNNSEYITAESKSSNGKNPSYRVKMNKRRNYLGSQRCSSGNIGQRSKVTSLAKENAFLGKLSSGISGSGVPAPQLMAIGQQTCPKQTFSLKYQVHQLQQANHGALSGSNSQQSHQYQSFVQQQASHRQ